jgi:hypothetical protein
MQARRRREHDRQAGAQSVHAIKHGQVGIVRLLQSDDQQIGLGELRPSLLERVDGDDAVLGADGAHDTVTLCHVPLHEKNRAHTAMLERRIAPCPPTVWDEPKAAPATKGRQFGWVSGIAN